MGLFGFFSSKNKETLDKGLEKTKESVFGKLARIVAGKSTVDDDVLDDLEEILITSDVGVDTTVKIIHRIEERVATDKYVSTSELDRILREEIAKLLEENHTGDNADWSLPADHKPYVILVVGVNGVGKTTSIGKMAYFFQRQGKRVILAAADTFRAGAIEQLKEWGKRIDTDVIAQKEGSDPAAVVFDELQSFKSKNADLLIIDTAGRLHNKKNLMQELGKINRIIDKEFAEGFRETLVVLDATTGQNAMSQAEIFKDACQVTGIILTKMDGTAKGGIALAVQSELGIPVKYIGTGEKATDLRRFDAKEYVDSIFAD